MLGGGIWVGIEGGCADAELVGGLVDANGDLTTVRNEKRGNRSDLGGGGGGSRGGCEESREGPDEPLLRLEGTHLAEREVSRRTNQTQEREDGVRCVLN